MTHTEAAASHDSAAPTDVDGLTADGDADPEGPARRDAAQRQSSEYVVVVGRAARRRPYAYVNLVAYDDHVLSARRRGTSRLQAGDDSAATVLSSY